MGAMQEVRALLASGASSGQVIAQGYAPGTVCKVQRQLRGTAGRPGAAMQARGVEEMAPRLQPAVDPDEENASLRARVAQLEAKIAEADEVCERLLAREYRLGWGYFLQDLLEPSWDGPKPGDTLDTLVHWLEVEAGRVGMMKEEAEEKAAKREAALKQERAARLEGERQAENVCRELADEVKDLRAKLRDALERQLRASQAATWAQWQLDKEREARVTAEQHQQLWADKAAEFEQANQGLTRIVMELEPLRGWAGHPCKVCKKPMSGLVGRELAATLQEDLAHAACIEERRGQGPGLGTLLVGAAALYGLARLAR